MSREKLIRLLIASKIARSQRRADALCRAGDKPGSGQPVRKTPRR